MPAKKEDYEKIFNKILGVDIRWSKLNLEDLIQLAVLFNNPSILIDKLGIEVKKEMGRKRLVEIGADWLEEFVEKVQWDGPLVQLARKTLVTKKVAKAEQT